jgi:hypothetical protein
MKAALLRRGAKRRPRAIANEREGWIRHRPAQAVRDFRLDDLMEAFERLPREIDGEPVTGAAIEAARRVIRKSIDLGVHPSRVVPTTDGVSIFYFPGGHACADATRVHASVACENDGEIAVLLTDRASNYAEAWAVSLADLDDAVERIRRFLRHGPAR